MFSTLFNVFLQNVTPVSAGVLLTLIIKAFFSTTMHKKTREYQIDIVKSRSKILQLQARNEELERLLSERKPTFVKDQLFLN